MGIEGSVIRLERRHPPVSDVSRMTDDELMAELRAIDPDEANRMERIFNDLRNGGPVDEYVAWSRELDDLERLMRFGVAGTDAR